jgi:hypothetical protein
MSGEIKSIAMLLLVLAPAHQAIVRDGGGSSPPRFEDYSFLQYVSSSGRTPSSILRLDDNGQIVLAARAGVTREALEAEGVPCSQSQVALLRTWRLLKQSHDTLRTAFPILGPDDTRRLRDRTRAAALALAPRIVPEIRGLRKELHEIGREKNAYSIIFSYVLDGLVWGEFERRHALDPREVTVEEPLWAGEVWALYPPRPFFPGTNTISEDGIALKVTWTDEALPRMRPFVSDFPTLGRLFEDYKSRDRVEDAHAREVFGPYDLFDASGRLTVPIIVEDSSNALYRAATAVARATAAEAPALLDLGDLASTFDLRDERQALIVAYHELMWDLLDGLEAQGLVRKPAAFATPGQANPADIAALVFVVRGSS